MKLYNKQFKIISLICFIFISFFIFIPNVKFGNAITSDTIFNFTNATYIDTNTPVINESYNLRNPYSYEYGYYNSTYTFTNEIVGTTGTSIDFIDSTLGTGTITVKDWTIGHNKTLEWLDSTAVDYINGVHDLDIPSSFGTVEFYGRVAQTSKTFQIFMTDSGTDQLIIAFYNNGYFAYSDGTFHDIITYSANIWYHIRLDFECSSGGYMGLSADTFYIYINGIRYGAYNLRGNPTTLNNFAVSTYNVAGITQGFIDSVGFSWYNYYDINENMYPVKIIDKTKVQVDKDEFIFHNTTKVYIDGNDNPNGYTDIEFGGGSDTTNVVIPNPSTAPFPPNKPDLERVVQTELYSGGVRKGIYKNNINLDGNYINITFAQAWDLIGVGSFSYNNFTVKSLDNTDIVALKMNVSYMAYDGGIYYLNLDSKWERITSYVFRYSWYYYNLFLNYELNICLIRIHGGSGTPMPIDLYIFVPLLANGKTGVNYISHKTQCLGAGGSMICMLDYIGLYRNGSSMATDYGFFNLYNKTYLMDFNSQKYFFLNIEAEGYYGVNIINTNGYNSFPFNETIELTKFVNYTSSRTFKNNYNYGSNIFNSSLIFLITNYESLNLSNTINYLKIDGFSLYEGINEYLMNFTYNNKINKQESYFYALNNRLYFKFRSNGSIHESMRAYFIINNLACYNASISFSGNYNSSLFNIFAVKYTDSTIEPIWINNFLTSYSWVLDQSKTITSLSLNITDSDYSENFWTVGWISPIRFNFLPSPDITITTISLLAILVPLLIILVPTFAISKKLGKKSVFIIFLFLTLICAITNLIPAWIFFIVLLGSIIFISIRYSGGND